MKKNDIENNAFWQSTLEEVVQCDEEDLDCPYGILWAYIYFHNLTIYIASRKRTDGQWQGVILQM